MYGTGAITNPYYGDFDHILAVQPTNTTIHLLPGIHYTAGNAINLPQDTRLIGAGIDTTTIRRDTSVSPGLMQVCIISSVEYPTDASGIEISDLTVDIAATNGSIYANNGINLFGDTSAVRRVKVIDASGDLANAAECFPIYVGSPGTTGTIISDCEVSSVHGDDCEGITALGQAVVSKNRVIFSSSTNGNGYQANGTCRAIFRDNYCSGGADGFYTDTYSETNLTLVGNKFENVQIGISVAKSGYDILGLFLQDNTISSASTAIVISDQDLTGQQIVSNVVVSGNSLEGDGAIGMYTVVGTNFIGVRVVNNTMSRNMALVGTGNWVSDNSDVSGASMETVTITNGTAYQLTPFDDSVLVTATTCANLYLANAWGFRGHEVLLVNEKTNNVTVSAVGAGIYMNCGGGAVLAPVSPANQILPSGSITLTPYQTVRLISDGNTNWIQQ